MWGATQDGKLWLVQKAISIHAPRVGSDYRCRFRHTSPNHFNPRSPCGERLGVGFAPLFYRNFNPRSPCGERLWRRGLPLRGWRFQSTLPVWGATLPWWRPFGHSPDFNPRSPCGERPHLPGCVRRSVKFQSTLPVWGATQIGRKFRCAGGISIHAPRVGSDFAMPQSLLLLLISIHAPRVGSDCTGSG